ncbi:MAG: hypothetical protein IT446_11795 [Phycisphaerales bacterium]|nr:hypothetical protein [Phycisphaerales bacterium]
MNFECARISRTLISSELPSQVDLQGCNHFTFLNGRFGRAVNSIVTRRVLSILAAAAVAAVATPAGAQSLNVDASGGTGFNTAIFGQNLYSKAYYTAGIGTGFEKNLELTNGTSLRGPSAGGNAMTYDWRTRVDQAQNIPLPGGGGFANSASTLDLLRMARDHQSTPIFTVNEQGIGTLDNSAVFTYSDKTIGTMTQLASDWVRYTNHILQTYRQGDTISDSEDQRILNSLSWGGPDFTSDLLLKPGEAAVPKVTYWEIGNEAEYYDDAATYRSRYESITTAMRAQDPTIKVGAGMGGPQADQGNYLKTVLKNGTFWEGGFLQTKTYSKLPVDFIAYHPYGYQILGVDAGNPANHGAISQQLSNIRTNQQAERNWVNDQINNSNGFLNGSRNVSDFEFLATEWNSAVPDPDPGQDGNWRFRQWNALGVVETAMTFAQMGFSAAQFWVWPADIYGGGPSGAELPQFKAFQALNQYGGDVLVQSVTSETGNRLYVTRDSQSGTVTIWGMNFLYGDPGDADKTFNISLTDLGITPGQITLMRLADTTGRTTLLSGNDFLTNGVTVDWITSDLTGQINLSNFTFTVKPAELAMLVIQVPEPSTAMAGGLVSVLFLTSRTLSRRKACASRPSSTPF